MSRSARLLFALLLTTAASCQDRNELMAPEDGDRALAPAYAPGHDGRQAASHADRGQASAGPVAPVDLEAVARYLPGAAPGAQATWKVIGPEGGSLRLGDFEVVVPAGAVTTSTRFQILALPETGPDQHAAAMFFPHGQRFAVPVTLRVPHASTEAAADAGAHVLWWDGGAWEETPTTVTPDGRLETTTDHFSVWGTQRRLGLTIIGG